MKIIDFEKKGNVVRFWLGEDDLESWWGDDWNDAPYEHNAGQVYEQYIAGHKDVAFDFDSLVMEPANDWRMEGNSRWTKDDMIDRRVPCIIVVPKEIIDNFHDDDEFSYYVGTDGIQSFYFGDRME